MTEDTGNDVKMPYWFFWVTILGTVFFCLESLLVLFEQLPSQRSLAWELEKCGHDLKRAQDKLNPPSDPSPAKDKYEAYNQEFDRAIARRDSLVRDCEQEPGQDTGHIAVQAWNGGVVCIGVHGLLWAIPIKWPKIP